MIRRRSNDMLQGRRRTVSACCCAPRSACVCTCACACGDGDGFEFLSDGSEVTAAGLHGKMSGLYKRRFTKRNTHVMSSRTYAAAGRRSSTYSWRASSSRRRLLYRTSRGEGGGEGRRMTFSDRTG